MTAVSDSSPLILLSKVGCLDLLDRLYPTVFVSAEVFHEVAVVGSGLPGAEAFREAPWIRVRPLSGPLRREASGLGAGELSTILLAQELGVPTVLLDDLRARKRATDAGLRVRGTVGLLEQLYMRSHISDLRCVFQQLIAHQAYVDPALLNLRLRSFGLDPL